MNKFFLQLFAIHCLVFAFIINTSYASENIITLKNGTIIKGSIEALADGFYTIQTTNLGQLKISASEISNINLDQSHQDGNPLAGMAQNSPLSSNPEIMHKAQELQQKMLSDPDLFQDLQNLANDKEIMNLISDPQLMKDLSTLDEATIKNNEKALQLMNNPALLELIHKLQATEAQK